MTDLYASLYGRALFPVWESVVRRRPTLSYLSVLERTQWASLDELYRIQAASLQQLLKHAYDNVPYYRRQMLAYGVSPTDFKHVDDIRKLPLLTREEARASFEARIAIAGSRPEIYKMTSGSTGQPLRFGYDRNSEYWRQAIKLRGYSWAGYRPGLKALHFWGSLDPLYKKPWQQKAKISVDRFLRREQHVDSNARSTAKLAEVATTIRATRPHSIVCFAQAGAALARYINESRCRDWPDIPVLCGAERLYPADRSAIQRAIGPAFETYGSREVMLMASECEAHQGLHTSMENLLIEVLVPEDGRFRPAAPGEVGEIAITDLHNYGAPFIRYLNGDRGIWEKPARCGCGRELLRLRSVEGRSNDTLRDGFGRPVDSLFFNVLFSVLADKVRHFQAIQHRDGSVSLKLVPTSSFDDKVLAGIQENCAKFLEGVPLRTELVEQIPLGPSGKLRVVMVEH